MSHSPRTFLFSASADISCVTTVLCIVIPLGQMSLEVSALKDLKTSFQARLHPVPKAPYESVSYSAVVDHMDGLAITGMCDNISRITAPTRHHHRAAHGLKSLIQYEIEDLNERLVGLDLEDFQTN